MIENKTPIKTTNSKTRISLRTKKISTKISLSIGILVIILSFILSFVNINYSSKMIKKEAMDNLTLLSESKANEFNILLQSAESSLKSVNSIISSSFDPLQFKQDENYVKQFDEMLSNVVKNSIKENNVLSMYLVFNPDLLGRTFDVNYSLKNGDLVRSAMFKLQDFDPNSKDMSWYYDCVNAGKPIWLKPYFWKDYNTDIISYEIPIYKNNELVAVLGTSFDFNIFKDKINSIKVYDNGYAFLLNNEYDFLVHPKYTLQDNFGEIYDGSYKFITDLMGNTDTKTLDYNFNGENKLLNFTRVSNGDIIVLSVSEKEIFSEMNSLVLFMLILSVAIAIVTILLGLFLGKSISKPILKVTELITKTENLDLVHDSKYDSLLKYNDEIGIMAKALFNTRQTLRLLVKNMKDNSDNINNESNKLATISNEMSSLSQNVSSAIHGVAQGTESQAEDLYSITNILNNFSEELENIVHSIKDIDSNAKDVSYLANESNTNAQTVILSVSTVSDVFKELLYKISTLNSNITEINEITNLINSIADQTNLLALNAAIEAARAGESGRGFSVVADEIRKLAEQTKASSENINSLIDKIANDTNIMVQTTDTVHNELDIQKTDITLAIDSFKKITTALDEILPKIKLVNNSITSVNNKKNTILEKIEASSSISEEISASSEEISASADETNSSTEEVALAAQKLSSMTEEFMKEINKFKL